MLQPQVIKIECQSDDEPMEDNFTGQMFIDNESGNIEALTITHNPQPDKAGNLNEVVLLLVQRLNNVPHPWIHVVHYILGI